MSMIAWSSRIRRDSRSRWSALVLLMVAAACGGDSPVPSEAAATVTTSMAATVATSTTTVPSVRITDTKGRAVKGALVRWKVTAGGGVVTNDSVRTAADGTASSGGWRLGTTAGLQTLTASSSGVPDVTFTATAAAGPVYQLNQVSTNAASPVVNTAVTPTPSVRAVDVYGNPVAGVAVTFAVSQGTGSVSGAQQTSNDQGLATVGAWTLGTAAGTQALRATATGATAATFTVTAVAGAAADLVRATSATLEGPSGVPVTIAPGVKVVDAYGNGVGNVPVTFTPGTNSGTVASPTVISDPANGTAFVGAWVLGAQSVQTLVATSTMLPGKSVSFTATVVASNFNLEVRFIGSPSALVQTAFIEAAKRWKQVIVGHVHDVAVNATAGICGENWIPAINESIHDVVIYARTTAIDGVGSILGQAFVCGYNTTNNMPVLGVMEFDEDDMASLISAGSLNDVILHEMGHVLGIGTLWNVGRSLLVGSGGSDPYFVGSSGRTEFAALNTLTYSGNPVPVENTGGAGTRDSHWRETTLTRELMTGFLDRNTTHPLSRLTVGSLKDLGYVVNLSAADSYAITAALYVFPYVQDGLELHGDVTKTPGVAFTPTGSVTRMTKLR